MADDHGLQQLHVVDGLETSRLERVTRITLKVAKAHLSKGGGPAATRLVRGGGSGGAGGGGGGGGGAGLHGSEDGGVQLGQPGPL